MSALLLVALVALVACTTAGPPSPSLAGAARSDRPCGWRAEPPRTYDHVVWVVLENHSYRDLIGPAGSGPDVTSPYLNQLARSCGLATNYWALTHPSPAELPRPGLGEHRRRDAVVHAGRVPAGPADRVRPAAVYPYVVRHNPPTYFPGVAGCGKWDLPMGTATAGPLVDLLADGGLPDLTVVIPDQCHNSHDCPISSGGPRCSSPGTKARAGTAGRAAAPTPTAPATS